MNKLPNFQDFRSFKPSRKMVVRFLIYGIILFGVLWWLSRQEINSSKQKQLPVEIDLEGVEF